MIKENDILSGDFLDFELLVTPEAKNQEKTHFPKSGNTIVFYSSDESNDDQVQFLKDILSAVKLDIQQNVSLLEVTEKTGYSFKEISSKEGEQFVLIFGVDPKKLGIQLDLRLYQLLVFQNYRFLLADQLGELQSDVSKKRALWNCLKEMFLA